jgi:hypothetical protein
MKTQSLVVAPLLAGGAFVAAAPTEFTIEERQITPGGPGNPNI